MIFYLCTTKTNIIIMSQRVQSILLFLSAIAFALLFFCPISYYYSQVSGYDVVNPDLQLENYKLYVYGVSTITGAASPYSKVFILPLLILTLSVILWAFYLSFSFFKVVRMEQMVRLLKNIRIGIVLIILWVVLLFSLYIYKIGAINNSAPEFRFGVFLPLISLVCMILAATGLKKDIAKVRSADRLR